MQDTPWDQAQEPLEALQELLATALPNYCPYTRPSPYAARRWSSQAATLLTESRKAQYSYQRHGQIHDHQRSTALSRTLKKELQRVARNNWRQFINESTKNPVTNRKGLWKLARWSRQRAGKPKEEPHLSDLRQTDKHPYKTKNEDKAQILANRFFPTASTADLSEIPPHIFGQLQELTKNQPIRSVSNQSTSNATVLEEPLQISEATLQAYIAALPNNKAPGPKGIPNEVLKLIGPGIAKKLLPGINQILATGQIPQGLRQSTTKILKKEGKKDYSLPQSYRPIALENALAKLCEKIVADELTQLAEQQDLLSWNQTGARKGKSTLSAISLISSCVQTP